MIYLELVSIQSTKSYKQTIVTIQKINKTKQEDLKEKMRVQQKKKKKRK